MESRKSKKKVYVVFAADILHGGHINILSNAAKYGDVIVGLLTDKAITSYKKLPQINFKQREIVLKNIKFVKTIIPQYEIDYTKNLNKIKPDYVLHGDDWKTGILSNIRAKVIKQLKKWNGKLIEIPYTKNISSTLIKKRTLEAGNTPLNRVSKLKRLIEAKDIVKFLECHNSLTGLIIENLSYSNSKKFEEFDGMWSSSLTDSLSRGKPDNQSIDLSTRLLGLNEILDVTTKPVIFDADNGGRTEHIPYTIKTLERLGVSSIVIEDKIGLKKNSLFKNQTGVKQDSIKNFSEKIYAAKKAKKIDDFFVVARIESLILKKGKKDAIKRAEAYSEAGADAILIHSKEKNPNKIFDFSKTFLKSKFHKPIIAVPSTYSIVKENVLAKNGIRVVIYANQLLRASYPAMYNTAKKILKHKRSKEAEKNITSIDNIINLI
jgi:phosphoenolpyruvate phosphomutase|tara:strand:- start:121 stop:1425 length:1305 start_codon:yes stop_codon:yes gene_type:complete